MSDAKLQVKIGGVEFSGEGSERWLSEQLKVILEAAPKLSDIDEPDEPDSDDKPAKKAKRTTAVGTLAEYLTAQKAGSNQVRRFLATAHWLKLTGTTTLTTAGVVKALKDKQQPKLSNASQSLNNNVKRGYAEKIPGGFFITPAGLTSLGSA